MFTVRHAVVPLARLRRRRSRTLGKPSTKARSRPSKTCTTSCPLCGRRHRRQARPSFRKIGPCLVRCRHLEMPTRIPWLLSSQPSVPPRAGPARDGAPTGRSVGVDNGATFMAAGGAKNSISGSNDGARGFTIPRRPVRKRLLGLPRFVIVRAASIASCRRTARHAPARRSPDLDGRPTVVAPKPRTTAARHSPSIAQWETPE